MQIVGSTKFIRIASQIAKYLNIAQIPMKVKKFRCGEYLAAISRAIDPEIIVVGSIINNDDLMEILSIIDAARAASAKYITLIAPYIAYTRQDVMQRPYSSVGVKIIANILKTAGVMRLITVDIHSEEALNFFHMDVTHIKARDVLLFYADKLELDKYAIIAPDEGSKKRLGNIPYMTKKRNNNTVVMELHGDVRGKNCLIMDDILDTGNTMLSAINCIHNNGGVDVKAYVTHHLGNNISTKVKLYTTDSAALIAKDNFSCEILSISPVICQFL